MSKLRQERIEQIIEDIRYEPAWRTEASREWAYYDGNQLDQATLQRMEAIGIPPIIVNLVKPTIDAVLGMEARLRADPIVRAETDEHTGGAEALNVKLKEATRLSYYNRATGDAFGSQAKVGLGWVEVSRESDPFKYPYRVRSVDRKEIWWDWRAREPDLSDARFIVRRRWYDAEELEGHFPRDARMIRQAISQRPTWESLDDEAGDLARAWEIETATSLLDEEWRDTERHRLGLYEVWYKVFESGWVLDLPDGRVVEFDQADPAHVQAVALDMLSPRKVRLHRIRVAYYLGPHQLADEPSPYRHGRFPYVPFFAYREDRSNAPYGLIRAMMSPQEEVNARRSKMLYNLNTRRVTIDKDAPAESHDRIAQEVARPDSYIILNQNRKNPNGFQLDTDAGLNQQQFQLMVEAKSNVQEASGLFHEFMGRGAGAGQSGEAIKSLVDQAQQVLGELMENYRESRRLVAELLLSLLTEDLAKQDDIAVPLEKATGEKRTVLLNHPEPTPFGNLRTNDVMKMRARVALDETPSSITYRQQTLQRMLEITQGLPENIQGAILDIVIGATDLPQRHEMVERIRAVTGVGGQPNNPEEAEQAQAQAQAEAEQQAQAQQMQMAEIQAKLAEAQARAMKAEADAQYAIARAQKTAGADTALTAAKVEHTQVQTALDQRESARKDMAQEVDTIERAAHLSQDEDRLQASMGPR